MAGLKLGGLVLALAAAVASAPARGQDATPPDPALTLELNGAQPSEKGCRLTFLVKNDLGPDLSEAGFEIALFDEQGVVTTLAVTRFDLSGIDCGKLSRVLVNHATQCKGSAVEPATCMRGLKTATRTAIEFGA